MVRIFAAVSALLFTVLTIESQQIRAEQWDTFSSSVGGFSILMPGEPQESATVLSHSPFYVDGLRQYSASVGMDVGLFSVVEHVYPERLSENLDRYVSLATKAANARVVEQKDVTISGLVGRRLTLETDIRGMTIVQEQTILVSGARLFQLVALSSGKPLNHADIDRFFESFKVTGDAKEWKPSRTEPNVVLAKEEDEPAQQTGFVTSFQCPVYPPDAKKMRLSGIVRVQVTTDGSKITSLKVTGHPILAAAAEANLRTWEFAKGSPETFSVDFFYVHQGAYDPDPVYHCTANLHLPTKVEVSTDW